MQSELGPVAVNTPRDRAGTFEPQLVGKRQTRLAGLDKKILGLYAGGMSVRDIESHLHDLYGVNVGRDTISRVTDAILEDVQAWRTRPLERVLDGAVFADLDHQAVEIRDRVVVRGCRCRHNPAWRGRLCFPFSEGRALMRSVKGAAVRALREFGPGFVGELELQGYSPVGATLQVRLMARVSSWMQVEGLVPGGLSDEAVKRFLVSAARLVTGTT